MPLKRLVCALLLAVLLPACASLRRADGSERFRLWSQAHHAFGRDSLQVATALFQRLAAEHPRTAEGRESRFYLGALYLDPRHPDFNSARSAEHLGIYLAMDSTDNVRVYRESAAHTLLRLARQFQQPCETRVEPLRCTPTVVVDRRPAGGAPAPAAANGVSAAEAERLRGIIADRDAEIRQLKEELQRIRNTLVPRRP